MRVINNNLKIEETTQQLHCNNNQNKENIDFVGKNKENTDNKENINTVTVNKELSQQDEEKLNQQINLFYNKAIKVYNEGNISKSIDIKRKSLKLFKHAYKLKRTTNNHVLLFSLANNYYEVHDFLNAKKFYEKTIKICPNHSLCNISLGNVYFEMGELETEFDKENKCGYYTKAVNYYENGIKYNEMHKNFYTYHGLIISLIKLDKEKEAMEKLKEIISKDETVAKRIYDILLKRKNFHLD